MRKLNAYVVYLIYHAARAVCMRLLFAIFMFYYVDTVGLNPLQLVLTGTALEISVLVFEIPTGIVADLYSRRLSIIIGLFIMSVGFVMSASQVFAIIFLAQMIWGFGFTFTSGATDAWLTDEIGEAAANRAFFRGTQVSEGFTIVGIIISVLLATINIILPIIIGGIGLAVLAVFLILFMPETGFTPILRQERGTFGDMQYTFGEGVNMVKRRPVLVNIMLIGIILGAFSEGYDRLWTAHLLKEFTLPANFEPIIWFGIIGVIGSLLGIAATEFTRRQINLANQEAIIRGLQAVNAILIAALLMFTLAGNFTLALAAIWLVAMSRNTIVPLYNAWLNQGLDARVRATVFSMAGQADAVGQIGGGVTMGLVANQFSVRVALLGSSLLLTPIMGMFRITLRNERKSAAVPVIEASS